jgi:hypothetical protein
LAGCAVFLRRFDQGREGDDLLGAVERRHELRALDQERLRFRVTVDEARFPDEAVVRLACELDEIDPGWQDHLAWPTAIDPAGPDNLDGGKTSQPER